MLRIMLVSSYVAFLSCIYFQAHSKFWQTGENSTFKENTFYLKENIPRQFNGWIGKEVPLGQTKEKTKGVIEHLQMDDYLQILYKKGEKSFLFYIAYWKPYKMPVSLVHVHKPDTCWPNKGWTLTQKRSHAFLPGGPYSFLPAQYRIFQKDGKMQFVYYWHIVGNTPYQNAFHNSSQFTSIHAACKFGFYQRQKQYFVRLSSNFPFETFWDSSSLDEFRKALLPYLSSTKDT